MADVYYARRPLGRPPLGSIFELPLVSLKDKLKDVTTQSLIPFLGAGASLPTAPPVGLDPPKNRPTKQQLDEICKEFGITEAWSQRFLHVAIQFAQLLDHKSRLVHPEEPQWAPSSWQLASRLAQTVALEPYRPVGDNLRNVLQETPPRDDYADIVRDAAEILGLSNTVPQLLTVASFFTAKDQRRQLLTNVDQRFRSVKEVTNIQKVIAARAKAFVDERNTNRLKDKDDYLILTTNYDQLMESWLAEQGVPTCVVTVDRDSRIRTKFMNNVPTLLGLSADEFRDLEKQYKESKLGTLPTPEQFILADKKYSLALVYKIHGCPIIDTEQRIDNLVISDHDYVLFIQKNGATNNLIPSYISNRIVDSSFLFLGYSFSDWNVRSLYQQIIRLRQQQQFHEVRAEGGDDGDEDSDYIVMRTYGDAEHHLFKQWGVSILVTDLDQLAENLS
jgi:hypothetical protein